MQQDQQNGVNKVDLMLALAIIFEAAFMCFCLIYQVSFLGTLLPIVVSIASVTITFLACRDFFRQHG